MPSTVIEEVCDLLELTPTAKDDVGRSKAIAAGPPLLEHYRLDDSGLYYEDPNARWPAIKICNPIQVVADTRTRTGDGWGRLLEWHDADDRLHRWPMPLSLAVADGVDVRKRLADGGLVVSPGSRVTEHLLWSEPHF